ncbi:hypothetical protein T03_16008, partial [Trichinella britovi]
LKRTNMEDKQWVCRRDAGVQSTRTWMWTQSWIVILMQMIASLTMTSFIKWRKNCSQAMGCGGNEDRPANIPRICICSSSRIRIKQCICRFGNCWWVSFQPIKVLKRQCTENWHKNFQDFRQLASSWRFHPTGECRSLIAAFYV